MTRMKICGLRREEDAAYLNEWNPDYAGVILTSGYRRSVDAEQARAIRKILNPEISLAGVFVDEEIEKILNDVKSGIIDIVQLHGHEPEEVIDRIQRETRKPVWKVFQMKEDVDFTQIENTQADLVLLDAGAGCGERFDWSLIQRIKRPFILAGGLTIENTAEAIRETKPYAVDISSGVETNGIKDRDKIAAWIQTVRKE